jgi:hypothetical protein
MSTHATHQGIEYELRQVRDGEWEWSFVPPVGPARKGRVVGDPQWTTVVVKRAIEVWKLMNQGSRPAAA